MGCPTIGTASLRSTPSKGHRPSPPKAQEPGMKLYIVADMEGATGITHGDQLMESGGPRYHSGCRLLTGDVNAVIEGALSEGVTDVLISEGHANMRNVLVEDLHPAARVIRGPAQWAQKPLCQVADLTDEMDVGIFVGFHSRAGTPKGLLSHTWAGAVVHRLSINGQEAGETLINAALLGEQGVPVALVCGADDLAREATQDLPGVEVAVLKKTLGAQLAACWGPKYTAPLLREAAAAAIRKHKAGAFEPLALATPTRVDLEAKDDRMTDRMALVPGVIREGRRHLAFEGPSVSAALSLAWRAISEVFHRPGNWLE